jgi:GH24 family phage-related lysozyme (muramidase)
MATENVLREFLVKIGFKVDEQKFKRFQESMNTTGKHAVEMTKNFVKLGEASLLAGTTMGVALTAAAKQLEGLYFASQRTGASAKELQTFGFAAEQVGVSAEQARAAVEGLASTRRTNPGVNGLLGSFGIDPRSTDNAKVLVSLLTKLHGMSEAQGVRTAGLFGIDQATFLQLNKNLPEMQKALAMREKLFSQTGVDPDKADRAGHEFMMQMRLMGAGLLDVSEIIAVRFMPMGEKVMGWVDKLAIGIAKADKATGGWSSRLIGLGVAAKALTSSWGIIGKIAGFGGKSAAGEAVAGEAAAGGAAVAGESAAGGGLLAAATALLPVLLPIIIGAAAVAAIGWVIMHPAQARAALHKAEDETKKGAAWTKAEAEKAGHGIAAETKALPGQLHSALHGLNAFIDHVANLPGQFAPIKALPGLISDVAQFTAKLEGHAKQSYDLYKDIAGNLTVGFGHLVKKGENFSRGLTYQGASALLAKDMQSAFSAVSWLVHAKVTENQMKALTDFAFNVGTKAFANSTLLKDVNKGDMAGAAEQFGHWNKVLVNGHYMASQGLANRRAAEKQLFQTPSKSVILHQQTDIHVDGRDAISTGREVARLQGRTNADLARNFAGATQ